MTLGGTVHEAGKVSYFFYGCVSPLDEQSGQWVLASVFLDLILYGGRSGIDM